MKYNALTKAISVLAGAITGGAMIITGIFVINKETTQTFPKEAGGVLAGGCYETTMEKFDCPPKAPPQYPPAGSAPKEEWTCLGGKMDQSMLAKDRTETGFMRPFVEIWELCPPGELWGYNADERRWETIRKWNDKTDGDGKTPTPCAQYINDVYGVACLEDIYGDEEE